MSFIFLGFRKHNSHQTSSLLRGSLESCRNLIHISLICDLGFAKRRRITHSVTAQLPGTQIGPEGYDADCRCCTSRN